MSCILYSGVARRDLSNDCNCKITFYEVVDKCESCHATCQRCTGTADTNCTECNETNFRKLAASGKCICLPNYFDNAGTCTFCGLQCNGCSAANTCTACAGNMLMAPLPTCTTCASGFYPITAIMCSGKFQKS